MVLMGIDQSLTGTGIVVLENGERHCYLLSTKQKKNSGAPTVDRTNRIISIKEQIVEILLKHKVDYVSIEGMAFGFKGKTNTLMDIGGLSHIIREALLENDVPFIVVPPTVLKVFFCGKGHADKLAMNDACVARGIELPFTKKSKGVVVYNDNVVDAVALVLFLEKLFDDTLGSYVNSKKQTINFCDGIEKSWNV